MSSKSKPRLAWVCPYLPAPRTSGGALRIQRLAEALHPDYELHLYCRGELWERSRLDLPELTVFKSRWLGRDIWQGGVPHLPRRVRRGSPTRLYQRIAKAHRAEPFQALILEHAWSAWGAFELGIPTLLDEHNIESAYLRDWFAARGHSGAQVADEVARMANWERRAWGLAQGIVCVSPNDVQIVRAANSDDPTYVQKISEVPNGVDIRATPFHDLRDRERRVLFVGALHHPPNAAAALRLATEIMPLVWQSDPNVVLDIVGPEPAPALLAAQAPRVKVHGRVPSVLPFLHQAGVFAFPLQHGAGSSLKTIEAAAAGVPLVSTRLGARGFPLEADVHYLPAESNADFAQAISHALSTPSALQALAQKARQVAESFDISALGKRFQSSLEQAITRGSELPS